MFKTIKGAADCEIRSAIHFFNAMISASIMAANMWTNSLKNVESNNNKILYENLLDFFYSETVLIF